MDIQLVDDLAMCHTDVNGALQRFAGNEGLYVSCLKDFLRDPTMDSLIASIKEKRWDDAFTAAHALKGVAGNMGFIPLYHAMGELVVLIRNGKVDEIDSSLMHAQVCYNDIARIIARIEEKPVCNND